MIVERVFLGLMLLALPKSSQVPLAPAVSSTIFSVAGIAPQSEREQVALATHDLLSVPRFPVETMSLFVAYVSGPPDEYSVNINMPADAVNRNPFSGMKIQAWLLCADGKTLTQKSRFDLPVEMNGVPSDHLWVFFDRPPVPELVGVVVSVDGKLFVHDIKASR